ncbi:MAG TPA: HAMP domain-containing sensor histidine kinase [Acidimicrobiales bacterium]|nr:HAMP domain-containing sensor histidine kinase [Acidimicrobiales bacterium]
MSLRRLWPERVRTRLTLLYALLFLAAGSALLGLTYGLVASNLSGRSSSVQPKAVEAQQLLAVCKSTPHPSPNLLEKCKFAFTAGAKAGSADQRALTLDTLLLYSLLGLGVMTVASGALGWVMAGRVLRPVRTITETARRASEEHLGERLALGGPKDELKELADTFDEMLERLDAAFASQRRFVANASHELRTPLTVMRTAIDVTLAKTTPTEAQLTTMAVKVRRAVDRSERLIAALLTLTTSDQGLQSTEDVDLATLVEDALDEADPAIREAELDVTADLDRAIARGDLVLLERMVSNLVQNAVHHNVSGGWVRVRTGSNAEGAFLTIANGGGEVPADVVPTLFEPFRRWEGGAPTPDDGGVGLGLSVVQAVAVAHGTTVAARTLDGGGLEFSVELPRGQAIGAPVAVPALPGRS